MSVVVQLVGVALVVAGGVWLFGPWALLVAGVLLVVVPELIEGRGLVGREEVRRS